MTKASSKNFQQIIFFLIAFVRIALFTPEYALGIHILPFGFEFSFKTFFAIASIVLFSIVFSFAVKKLLSLNKELLAFPLLLICLDPAFFYAFYNPAAMIILALEIGVVFMTLSAQSQIKKSLLLVIFSFIATLIAPASLFSHVPLMLMVFILYNFNSGKMGNAKLLLTCVLVAGLSVAASAINEQVTPFLNTVDPFYFSNPFFGSAFITTMPAWEFLVMYAPFFVIGFVFLGKYMQAKEHGKKIKACTTVLILLVYSVMLVGVFKFNHLASFTMLNLTMPLAIIALYIKDSSSAGKAIACIMNWFRERAGISIILLIIWMFFAVNFLKSVTYSSLWSIIFTNTGYLIH